MNNSNKEGTDVAFYCPLCRQYFTPAPGTLPLLCDNCSRDIDAEKPVSFRD